MTLAEMRTAVQGLGFGTDTATIQTAAINSIIRRIEGMHRWPWQEATTGSAALAVGASALTSLPADLLHVDTVRLEAGTDYVDLAYERPAEIRRLLHVDRDNGTPTLWSKWASQVIVYNRSDLVYAATLDYVKDPTDLSADGDTWAAPATYHDIPVWGAAAQMAARERDWSMVATAKQEMRERIGEMEDELGIVQRQTSREVVRSDFWTSF